MQRIVCPDTESWTMVERLYQRRCGKTWKRPVVEFGESVHFRPVGENNALRRGDQRLLRGVYVGNHERSGAAMTFTPDGMKRGTRIARMMEHERWDSACFSSNVCWSSLAIETRSTESGETCCT